MTSALAVRTSAASPRPPSASNWTPRRSAADAKRPTQKGLRLPPLAFFRFGWRPNSKQFVCTACWGRRINALMPSVGVRQDDVRACSDCPLTPQSPFESRLRPPYPSKPPQRQAFPLIFCPYDTQSRKFRRHTAQMHGSSLNSALHNMASCLYINLNSREHRETAEPADEINRDRLRKRP